ncbi:formate dehydrogenase accessory sulfurtransferase FdhD [Limimaricola variabilis]|uniref:formate dehydrogenase accessory sulfurtransferase FdhD n=1 Tax=Limimaricola variabilis TaxID=1492771 RepID=UPI002AC95947|nr:formate dehydrogenase accessory sulfurtransferase FdhD [Limimaricola variabilis]WPY94514.1 formate dehydrogenase accessory sulfurtransferase FdhD [Limimaricola variabilis]
MSEGLHPYKRVAAHDTGAASALVSLPEETPVAVVYNGSTQAVMMTTPADIEDFARGFTITEGFAAASEIGDVEIVRQPVGIEARIWLPEEKQAALDARRRAQVGPVGCGLCGIDSLAQAAREVPRVPASGLVLAPSEIGEALDALRALQPLHDETRAVHAAGFYVPGQGIVLAREDVGRHNALDKLAGAMAAAGTNPASGAVVLTSRLSLEMVQKTAMIGAPVMLSVSQPTATAVALAETAGIALVTRNRHGTRIFTHHARIGSAHVL